MAKLIVKSPYIKCTGGGDAAGAGGYLHYIGTREHVQTLVDDRPPTRKQEQLLAKLTKDFSGVKQLDEYGDYEERPTKATASALITMALEENWSAVSQMDGYLNYIATRPRAQRLSTHGLFGDEDGIDLKEAMEELNSYESAATTLDIYTHITDDMRHSAAASIDRGIGKAEPAQSDAGTTPARQEAPRMTDFKPYVGRKRKPGTGCVSEINDHLFEGRYSPMWSDGKKHARNVYAKTREECEEKLKVLIVEMKKEIAELKTVKPADSVPQ